MSVPNLDLSLDDIISKRKQEKKTYPKRFERRPFRQERRPFAKRREYREYREDREDREDREEDKGEPSKTRLHITDIHYEVSNDELRVLFESVGPLKECAIKWDEFGRSKGEAYVEYETEEHAAKALKEYNGAELDGLKLTVTFAERPARRVPKVRKAIHKNVK
eukprot:TRINITY_DN4411_c0_g1_i8.p1 TRINITY_DN4411_c0_g1~~TRINITY_DN4411_c0_g1_i8.p1  ORF type:complete len:164 (-),score=43.03 TRINITY_DN4411_c0_g1_i8:199-690(-)